MKENKYDDNIFFQKYSQMSRSQQGLAGAGEWETLRKLLPDFKDKRVLDLGCGYGWHCIYAMEHDTCSLKHILQRDISRAVQATCHFLLVVSCFCVYATARITNLALFYVIM